MNGDRTYKCCLSGRTVHGYGNNPVPVKPYGECCNECNWAVVVPERIRLSKLNNKKGNQ